MTLLSLVYTVLLQPPPSSGGGGGGGGAAAPGGIAGCDAGSMNIGFLIAMFAIFYFLLIRPQQKRAKEHDEMLSALKKGDKVRTAGGIAGEIIEIREKEVILKIAEKTKINILRSQISGRDEVSGAGGDSKKA